MKKVYLIGALTGLMMASCANDDLVVKPASGASDGEGAISFATNIGNQSRANLEKEMDNFGVWTVKADGVTDLTGLTLNLGKGPGEGKLNKQVVMDDYKVWYDAANTSYGSHWTYVDTSMPQYLKYWDGKYTNTYFFAYGPHNSERVDATGAMVDKVSLSVSPDDKTATLAFPKLITTTNENYNFIYADAVQATNVNYITGDNENPAKVPLTFHRLMSKVKIAFWESIPGYTVEIEGVNQPNAGEAFAAGNYVAAIPANYTAKANTSSTINIWDRGGYNGSGKANVVYSGTGLGTTTIAYTGVNRVEDNIYFTAPDGKLGETRDDAVPSNDEYFVLPNTGTMTNVSMASGSYSANSGLQFVVNYVLKAEDTNEEIHVKGARVYVPAAYTAWAPNTVYTYYFQITKDSSGTTTDVQPTNKPDEPYDALYPIIFDNVTIDNITEEDTNWVINQNITLNYKSATITAGHTLNLQATLKYLSSENTNQTVYWTISDSNVASLSAKSSDANAEGKATVTITAKNPGRATVTATNNGITAICNIIVIEPVEP